MLRSLLTSTLDSEPWKPNSARQPLYPLVFQSRPPCGRRAASQCWSAMRSATSYSNHGLQVRSLSGTASESVRPSITIASTISPDAARGSGVRRARGTGPSPAALVLPRHALVPAQADRCRRKRGSRWNSQTFAAVKSAADALSPCAIGQIPLNPSCASRFRRSRAASSRARSRYLLFRSVRYHALSAVVGFGWPAPNGVGCDESTCRSMRPPFLGCRSSWRTGFQRVYPP